MSAIFVSDVHLHDGTSLKSQLFVRFLQEQASQFERIYILGDLFDVWPATSSFFVRVYKPVIASIKKLVQGGHLVSYFEGNHDFHLGEYFQESLGVRVITDSLEEDWGDKKILMTHGDLGNPQAYGYRLLRNFLRLPSSRFLIHVLPQQFLYNLGIKSSQLSRAINSRRKKNNVEMVRSVYRKQAEQYFRKGYDVVIMGHTHVPDDYTVRVQGRECRYLNTGDWVRNFTYIEFDGREFYTRTHPVKSI